MRSLEQAATDAVLPVKIRGALVVPDVSPLAYIGNVSRTTASGRVSSGCETFSIRR